MKNKIFYVPLLQAKVQIVLVKDITKVNKLITGNFKKDKKSEPNYLATTFDNINKKGYVTYFICFKEIPSNNTLSHEIVHLISFLYRDYGIKHKKNNDEWTAYLTGYLFETIEEILYNFKNKKSKNLNN